MSTPQDGVVVTRAQRDALHHEIRNYELASGPLGDLENMLVLAGRGETARELWQRVAVSARLLEDIGWDRNGDRDRYSLTMEPDVLARWAQHQLEQTEATLSEKVEAIPEIRAGRDPWAGPGELRTAESVANDLSDLRALMDRDLDAIAAYRAILEQLGAR